MTKYEVFKKVNGKILELVNLSRKEREGGKIEKSIDALNIASLLNEINGWIAKIGD